MTFSLPQAEDSPTYPAQALVDSTDLLAIQAAGAGSAGSGVVSGCAVTPHSSGVDLNVNVASGSVIVAGAPVSVSAATNVTVGAASTHDRRDIVTVNSSGTVSTTAGKPCSVAGWTTSSGVLGPVKPAIPASSVLLAEVYVPGTATSITASNIVAKAAPIGTSAPGTLLAIAQSRLGTDSSYAVSGSSLSDIDATNLAATFTTPASGRVLVVCSTSGLTSGNANVFLGVREGTTSIAQGLIADATPSWFGHQRFLINGLTPGSSHTYKFAAALSSGTLTLYSGPTFGPLTIEVYAA